MTTLSSFRINQPPGTPYANYDRARKDVVLGAVEFEAYEKAQGSYKWEFESLPQGVSVTINNSTTHTANGTLDTTGGYLVRLTVNEGEPNESITTLYMGVVLAGSGLAIPALAETNQDNSDSPYDGARGSESKSNAFRRAVDQVLWRPVVEITTNTTLDSTYLGKTIVPSGGAWSPALPDAAQGLIFSFYTEHVAGMAIRSNEAADGEIHGPWAAKYGTTGWAQAVLTQYSSVTIAAVDDGAGGYEWMAVAGEGRIMEGTTPTNLWDFSHAYVEDLATAAANPAGYVPVANGSGGLAMQALTQFSQIIDPAASTLTLLANQSGALVMTANSTSSKGDIHDIHLPTPAAGLVFTVQHTQDTASDGVSIEVDDDLSEVILLAGVTNNDGTSPWSGTIIGTLDSALLVFIGMSSTEWQCIHLAGRAVLNADQPGSDWSDLNYANGAFDYINGGGSSPNSCWLARGRQNTVDTEFGQSGQLGWMFGYNGSMVAARAATWGGNAKARAGWRAASVTGIGLDSTAGHDDPGNSQTVRGQLMIAKTTDSATWVEMKTGISGGGYLRLEDNLALSIKGKMIAKTRYDVGAASKTWEFEALIKVDNGGTPTVQDSTIVVTGETAYRSEDTWDFDLGANTDVNGPKLYFQVKGENTTIYWICELTSVEAQFFVAS